RCSLPAALLGRDSPSLSRDFIAHLDDRTFYGGSLGKPEPRSSRRLPPQAFAAVIRRRGFADFVDVDAVVTDKNGPQHGLLSLVTDRASGCPRWGLGNGLRFLDLVFEPGDLHLKAALVGLQFFDTNAQAIGLVRAGEDDVVARRRLRDLRLRSLARLLLVFDVLDDVLGFGDRDRLARLCAFDNLVADLLRRARCGEQIEPG